MKSTTKEFATNDQANYYSGITSIKVNGKNAYELKGKFLDDLHNNGFSRTNGEDAVKHIEYFPKIVDPIDLPNVNYDKLRVVVFPISLVGDAWRWFDEIKGSIDSWSMDIFTKGALWDYWKLGSDEIEPTNDEPSDLKETDHDDEQEIYEIFRIKTNLFDYETRLPMKNLRTIRFMNGTKMCHRCLEWPTYSWREDGYCNGGNLPRAYIVGNSLHYQDFEWYDALKDSKLKDEALRNKAIMEGLINDDVEAFPVCTVRRFEMIKYSFGQDEEYVAVKEDEYKDLTSIREDACQAYQEIFRMMEEGWMELAEKKLTKLVKYLQSGNLEVLKS
ncbi:hypothetical protein Tco_1064530 [Tanacetum coccineum]